MGVEYPNFEVNKRRRLSLAQRCPACRGKQRRDRHRRHTKVIDPADYGREIGHDIKRRDDIEKGGDGDKFCPARSLGIAEGLEGGVESAHTLNTLDGTRCCGGPRLGRYVRRPSVTEDLKWERKLAFFSP